MKKLAVLAIMASAFTMNMNAQTIKGSDTVLPVSQEVAEKYMKENPSKTVTVTGGGSGVGLAALVAGTTDIAMASRKIKFDEKVKIQEAGRSVTETVIAYDALAVVINPSNTVSQLTREQLESIFTGKITNWKQVGGADLKIVCYSRETSSGTYEFFKESVLKNKNYMSSILSMPATGAIIQSVSQTKGAIGYVGLAYMNKDVKALKVSYDKGKTYVAPSVATAKDKSYPVVRPLFYYYSKTAKQDVKALVEYVLSQKGQSIIQEVGYITLK